MSPIRPGLRRRAIRRRKSAANLQIRHNHIQSAQLLPKPRRAVPLAPAPVATARQTVVPARALRRSAFGRRPQDEVDLRLEVGGGCGGLGLRGRGDVGDAGDVGGDGGGGEGGYERSSLGEGAGEDGAIGELVDVAVVVGRAGDFGEGAVGAVAVAAGGEGCGDCWDEGGVEGGPAGLGLGEICKYLCLVRCEVM